MSDFIKRRQAQIEAEREEQEREEVLEELKTTSQRKKASSRPVLPRNLATAYYEETQSWMHPFSEVYEDDDGYFITFDDNPDAWRMRVGDLIQDVALNKTPYWRVSETNQDTQRVDLEPIAPNPIVTGVGAGGAKITKEDLRVLSGAYEAERVERTNERILQGDYHSIDDVQYLLLGTVALRFGPNGPEGGWYNANDTMSNRGGRERMSAREIVQADANTLRKLNFVIAPDVENEIDIYQWDRFVSGGYHLFSDFWDIEPIDFTIADETLERYAEHRNLDFSTWSNFEETWNKTRYQERWDLWRLFETELEDYKDLRTTIPLLDYWQTDIVMRSAMCCLSFMATTSYEEDYQLAQKAIHRFLESGEAYWFIYEKIIIALSEVFQDVDGLRIAATLPDPENRRYAYAALGTFQDEYLKKAVYTETNPQCVYSILRALLENGYMPGREVTYFIFERLKDAMLNGDTIYDRYGARDGLITVGDLARKQRLPFYNEAYKLVRDYDEDVRRNPTDSFSDEAWLRLTVQHMQQVVKER